MFCPQCGNKQSDELKFCNLCGANLYAVRQVVATRATEEKFDWSKTWVAEMMLSESERNRRQADFEQKHGLTPEIRRYNEIKGGVITAFVGVGVMLFLAVLGPAIANSGQNPPGDAEIIRNVWVVGVIPFLVGLALIFNGLFVSKKIVELQKRARGLAPEALPKGAEQPSLKAADTSEFIPTGFSVTEGTTKHLTLKDER
ncbi:MAG TPA: zinc ribbon domain-containing protein [Pyrinomonadaceae bacterium]|nr:zinc ribbon domain-containing protein [Pyrinomonadaceae bacterium]